MSARPTSAEPRSVTLIRPGVGTQVFNLPEGATLADLLRIARVGRDHQSIFIDERPLEETLVLAGGETVSVVPSVKDASHVGEWKDVIGAFHGDAAFDAMMEQVDAEREAEKDAS